MNLLLARLASAALLLVAAAALYAAPLDNARQLIVVTSETWDSTQGQLQAFVRDGKHWRRHGQAFPVALGRTGSAWGLGLHPAQTDGPQKQEGDGRSPAGVFALGSAFGYAITRPGTAMTYQPMLESSYCMDVPASPFYNRIVDAKKVGSAAIAGSTEPMRLDLHNQGDVRYREGFVIAHNPDNQPGKGSCIFAHLWRQPGEATAGCTAMPEVRMQALLDWLRPQDTPRFVLLPRAEYQRLQAQWKLPALEGAVR
ncbi:L,D-transpeptidase family protein [Stenotrophomonas sp. 1337]|uniref:L,D-transpeptidase family protein n=1 Tax=Stenotrophomonas sp. 1337 TaxID=2817757 RepID=UPI002865DDC7|nr:L,D-transpeptidase family protein [Stenotrophomonas sp. 1337]MDR6695505.1 L,D-peptidoglycan transpeptidase YkuD (ErfK/YbiS/YcfS/YnhG family) [Stenotrophomonas sp. 1337]